MRLKFSQYIIEYIAFYIIIRPSEILFYYKLLILKTMLTSNILIDISFDRRTLNLRRIFRLNLLAPLKPLNQPDSERADCFLRGKVKKKTNKYCFRYCSFLVVHPLNYFGIVCTPRLIFYLRTIYCI